MIITSKVSTCTQKNINAYKLCYKKIDYVQMYTIIPLNNKNKRLHVP